MSDETREAIRGFFADLFETVRELAANEKLVAMVCLTTLGVWSLYKLEADIAVQVVLPIATGIAGFVTGDTFAKRKMNGNG